MSKEPQHNSKRYRYVKDDATGVLLKVDTQTDRVVQRYSPSVEHMEDTPKSEGVQEDGSEDGSAGDKAGDRETYEQNDGEENGYDLDGWG